jgi:hypothetical protein
MQGGGSGGGSGKSSFRYAGAVGNFLSVFVTSHSLIGKRQGGGSSGGSGKSSFSCAGAAAVCVCCCARVCYSRSLH